MATKFIILDRGAETKDLSFRLANYEIGVVEDTPKYKINKKNLY